MEVWSGWSPVFWPGGEIVSRVWGRRVEQLALPMRPLDVARGMDSRVTPIRDREGTHVVECVDAHAARQRAAGVQRRLLRARTLPGADRPSVHVAFPLESGNVQVFLRPTVVADGGLLLASPAGRFGEDGAYVVVRDAGTTYAARVPLHETFHVYVDDGRRAAHRPRPAGCGRASAVRLHYKLERLS